MKYKILTTIHFDKWLKKQKDRQAVRAIAMRIARAEQGNLGDSEPVGEGVSEMRIFIGKGYRVYYVLQGNTILLILNGGIKVIKNSNKKILLKQNISYKRPGEIIMSEKIKPFNPFDYLDTQEEINAYLEECFKNEDPNVFVSALGHLAKHHGMSEVAKSTGLNRESLYKTFNGKVQPKWDTIARVMRALQVDLTVAA